MQEQAAVRPVRVGVIGLGAVAEAHIKSYRQLPDAEVVAAVEASPVRGREVATTLMIPDLYTSYEELLEREDIDAVSICVPNFLHAPIGLAALRARKHVLCEKPLALNAEEAQEMVDAAREANRVLRVSFNHRRRGDALVLKQHIDDGGLGRIYYAKAYWMRRSGVPGVGSWFTSKQKAGGGPLIDLGVHMLDLAMYLLGEPEALSVTASTYAELAPRGYGGGYSWSRSEAGHTYEVEDLATAFVRLEGDVTLLLEASWATHSSAVDDFGVVLYGTDGGAEIAVKNYSWEGTLRIFNNVGGRPADTAPRLLRGEGHLAVIRDFIASIRSGEEPLRGGLEGLRRTGIIDACYRSAAERREVALGPVDHA